MILPDGSEDGLFSFLIYASSDENAMLAWAFEEHRDSETKHTERVLSRLGRTPGIMVWFPLMILRIERLDDRIEELIQSRLLCTALRQGL